MEEKVRVWDKEVTCCALCKYFKEVTPTQLECNAIEGIDNELQYYDIVNDNCPFKQPITKELICSYGVKFKYNTSSVINTSITNTEIYENDKWILWYGKEINELRIRRNNTSFNLEEFSGTCYNAEEFKFICSRLGITINE